MAKMSTTYGILPMRYGIYDVANSLVKSKPSKKLFNFVLAIVGFYVRMYLIE